MAGRIEEYALLGDTRTSALVGANGSIDWWCLPRFDSPACFAALLGTPEQGRWLVAPATETTTVTRAYRDSSMVLETTFRTRHGTVRVTDAMLLGEPRGIVRRVDGVSGTVPVRTELVLRPEYGLAIPWMRRDGSRLHALAGPDAFCLDSELPVHDDRLRSEADAEIAAGDRLRFALHWYPSVGPAPDPVDVDAEIDRVDRWWRTWAAGCSYEGRWRPQVLRSLLTLKALTFAPTGGVVAAATTSLPEDLGGTRNWDYRYCWLRDAAFTLQSLLSGGFQAEAAAWRDWLLRAAAGHPAQLQVLYGVAGERWLPETEIGWLPGYEHSAPVRVGNDAYHQFQLDVFGEVLDTLAQATTAGLPPAAGYEDLQATLLEFLESRWREPDDGIWEVRGGRRHFTHSKVMAWVAADRAARMLKHVGSDPSRWCRLAADIHTEVCQRGVDPDRGVFVQSYGSRALDAALLAVPLVGFLPTTDPRVAATVAAVEAQLSSDGFVARYQPDPAVEGLAGGEGAFLLCTFWLAQCRALLGQRDRALACFDRLLAVANDVGLLAEEYDVARRRMVGNFPQAFSHVALVNTACMLSEPSDPVEPASSRAAQT
jgi:GH15 family glucan-1,4-alpha-glucosidase